MKRLLAVVLVVGCGVVQADELSREDRQRLAAYYTLHVIDWGQTRFISDKVRNCTRFVDCGHEESNPILGPEPSAAEVNRYFLATGVLYLGAVYILPPGARRWFQYATISLQLGNVAHNYNVGVRVDF